MKYMKILNALLNILFPPTREVHLPALPATAFTCPVCRGRIPFADSGIPNVNQWCHPQADYLLIAIAKYSDENIQELIWQLKFRRRTAVAAAFGRAGSEKIRTIAATIDCVVPIPLSARRLRDRGFNQAELIALAIAEQMQKPCHRTALRRQRHTKPQSEIKNWQLRAQNLDGCFALDDANCLENKTVLLIDDVWTSGATMGAAATTIKKAGARQVIALVVARAS